MAKRGRPSNSEKRYGAAEWREMQRQFSEAELEYFEERYATWMEQLKEDFVASEETQVILLLKTEILMNRNLAEKQKLLLEQEQLEKMLEKILSKDKDPTKLDGPTQELLQHLTEQINTMRTLARSFSTEFVKLQEKHADLSKSLKATRDQRLKRIENSKVGFVDLIKDLMKEERRLATGESMELMRLAAERERAKLREPHAYADGQVDSPLLLPEQYEDA